MKKVNHEKKHNLCKLLLAVVAITALALPCLTLAKEDGIQNLVTKETAKHFDKKSYSPYVGRKIGKDGRCKTPVGSTVNIPDASYTNTIGDPLLTAHWVDPDFDPKQRAFYYVRVIEIPTLRWTAYDAKRFGITMRPEVPMTVTERAYTSPIRYTP